MDKQEIVKKESEFERKGLFSEHIVPPNLDKIAQVGPDYDYKRSGFFNKIGSFFSVLIFRLVGVFVAPYCRLKVIGKKNLKSAKKAIITSNHINNIDCVLIKHVLHNKPLKIIVADFNNPKGIFGAFLRAGGTLPLSKSVKAMGNLSKAITYYLDKNNFILVYPETAEWWCYEKPRPLARGCAFYACHNNVPIIPMFFTFKNRSKSNNGICKKNFILNVGTPLYPNAQLPMNERIEDLLNRNFEFNKMIYENFYKKDLEYEKE